MAHIPEGDRMQSRIMCLDDMVAKEAMVRIIDRFINIVNLQELGFGNTIPSTRGRNSYSPKTLAKLFVFCYTEGIRSSRRIEKACTTNIEVMWLTGDLRPDFKSIADFRRDKIDALPSLFYEFSSFLDSAGLFGKKIVAIDGTKIRASNSKKRNISKKSLERRKEHHEKKVAHFLDEMEKEDDLEALDELKEKAKAAQRRADEAEALIEDMDEAAVTEISLTDPDARCMGKGRWGMQVAYNVQAAVDSKHHLMADLDITNRPDDHDQLSNMAKRTQQTMRKRDMAFLADKGYYSEKDLRACKDADINCVVSPQGKSKAKKGYALDSFFYDKCADSYLCPEGKELTCKSRPTTTKSKVYSNKQACLACKAVKECKSSGLTYRKVLRRPGNDILDWADERYHANTELYRLRQQIAEHPFGTIKRAMGGDHFLLRGFEKVRCEAALLFMGYNLKRSFSVLGFTELMAKLDEYAALIGAADISSLNTLLFSLVRKARRAFWKVSSAMDLPMADATSPA
jgi:transposase